MRSSDQTEILDSAIALLQGELTPVTKNKEVAVSGESKRTGEAYGYTSGYATHAATLGSVRKHLAKHGIALYQGGHRSDKGEWSLVTRIAKGGQWIEAEYPIKASRDGAQGFGGGVSFAKRWGLRDILAIEIADDAEEKQGYVDARKDARPAKRAPAPPGIKDALARIRGADTVGRFEDACASARGAFPTGEAAAEVERTISAWLVHAFGVAENADQYTELRDTVALVKPRGGDVPAAIQNAGERIGVPR